MKKYKAVVVGCGGRSRDHILPYQWIENAEVTACCAPHPERREKLAAEYGLRAYADAEEMLRVEKPDIVHLVTWPDTRVELMSLVSAAGVPLCTVEKPVATGVQDWRALVRLEQTSRTRFAVCHQVRWQPYLARCQQALADPADPAGPGRVLFLDISAGMNIAGQGTHTLNYGRSLTGDARVASVSGSASGWDRSDPGHPAPAVTQAALTFATGLRGLWTSGAISPRCGDPTTTWQHVRTAAYAERGRVLYEEFGRWETVSPAGTASGDYGGMSGWRQNNLLAQAGFHRAMFAWLEGGPPPGTNLAVSLHEWQTVLALYTSALRRRPVDLDGFEPEDDLFHALEKELG